MKDAGRRLEGGCDTLGHLAIRRGDKIKLGSCNFCTSKDYDTVVQIEGHCIMVRACDKCFKKIQKSKV